MSMMKSKLVLLWYWQLRNFQLLKSLHSSLYSKKTKKQFPHKLISGLTAQGRGSTLSGSRRHRPAGGCWGVSPWGGEMDKQLSDSLQHIGGWYTCSVMPKSTPAHHQPHTRAPSATAESSNASNTRLHPYDLHIAWIPISAIIIFN